MNAPSELCLKRAWKKGTYTIGKLLVDNEYWCNTLEDTDRDLHAGMSDSLIRSRKVYGKTAIPRGQYAISLTYSPKFAKTVWGRRYEGLVPLLHGVKGFDGIRIHPGNKPEDTLGCLLPGENKVKGQVINSTKWYYKLMDEVFMPAYRQGRTVTIDIQ